MNALSEPDLASCGAPARADGATQDATVRCTASTPERTITFDCPPGATLLDAALAAGWELPYSCRRGSCETCRADIVSGQVAPAASADGSALLCCTRPLSDVTIAPLRIERKTARDEPRRVTGKLYRLRWAASDVAVLDIRFPAGTRAAFKAGQYLNVLIDGHEPRSFSMANAPRASDGVQLHVRVVPGGLFGQRLKDGMAAGEPIDLELPFGDFHLREAPGKPAILVAGGTGFAPMQSLLEDALAKNPDREFTLYWGGRNLASLYAMDQIARWQRRHKHFRFVGVLSEEPPPAGLRAGLVHQAVLADHPSLADCDVYVCGAPGLVQAARADFTARGLPPDRFFADSFVTPGEQL